MTPEITYKIVLYSPELKNHNHVDLFLDGKFTSSVFVERISRFRHRSEVFDYFVLRENYHRNLLTDAVLVARDELIDMGVIPE